MYQSQDNQQYQQPYQQPVYQQPVYQQPVQGLEEPMSLGEWMITLLIMFIPCVNIVMMFVWAFSKNQKQSKSNFFKAQLIYTGIVILLYLIVFVVFGVSMASMY